MPFEHITTSLWFKQAPICRPLWCCLGANWRTGSGKSGGWEGRWWGAGASSLLDNSVRVSGLVVYKWWVCYCSLVPVLLYCTCEYTSVLVTIVDTSTNILVTIVCLCSSSFEHTSAPVFSSTIVVSQPSSAIEFNCANVFWCSGILVFNSPLLLLY